MADPLWLTWLLIPFGFMVAYGAIPHMMAVAARYGFMSAPGGRRSHPRPTPLLGGVAIYAPFAIVFLCFLILRLSGALVFEQPSVAKMVTLFVGATWILILGTLDDREQIGWPKKLIGQFLAALILVLGGHTVAVATVPFAGPVDFGWFGPPLLIMAVILLTNAINLIDGLDGLAGGICFFAALTSGVIAVVKGDAFTATVAFTISGALLGFLVFNFPPASIFMGDGGSMMTGFVLATLATSSAAVSPGQRLGTILVLVAPFLPFGIPVFEVGLSITRRWIRGQAIFLGDGNHLHHRLIGRIKNPRLTVGVFYFFSAALCALTLFIVLQIKAPSLTIVAGLTVLILFGGALASLRLYRIENLVDTIRNRRHFKFLGGFLGFMKQRLKRAGSLSELLELLESGVKDLAFDSVEVLYRGETIKKWSNPRPIHVGSPRIHSEETFDESHLTVKWARPAHDDDCYNEYLMLTWHRFLNAFKDEMALHTGEVSRPASRKVVEFTSKLPK
ncbi:MAG: undecaprenyl/decaprenyl-phosphate alpha-N-acetylglucosaminyl 1-phosphate transferase [Deltaproteobacteria bacterium]|nr:undecaprenyl/decaprenyl-phosphate alpha-N-acetylglucosaminyl 1-phosphate transferase [Deltaproteobacteria bacterium]